jgi:SAM-dependent methyltransferase
VKPFSESAAVLPTESKAHGAGAPSAWVQRWTHLVQPGGTVLDVACGHGRHVRWFLEQKHRVAAVDYAQAAIDLVATLARTATATGQVEVVLADIENGPWPFTSHGRPRQFDAVVVTNYLWRALFPTLLQSLAPGGVLLYETFAAGNETVGKPSRPDFLLHPGELLGICQDLHIVAYEDGFCESPDRFVQRIAAVRPADAATPSTPAAIPRYRL